MSWTDADRYHRTLRAVEHALDLEHPVPWGAEHAEVFGTPERLRLALTTRWRTIVQAQAQDLSLAELVAAHPGLARAAGVRASAPDRLLVAS